MSSAFGIIPYDAAVVGAMTEGGDPCFWFGCRARDAPRAVDKCEFPLRAGTPRRGINIKNPADTGRWEGRQAKCKVIILDLSHKAYAWCYCHLFARPLVELSGPRVRELPSLGA